MIQTKRRAIFKNMAYRFLKPKASSAIHSEDVSAIGEARFIAIGMSFTFKILVVVYTFRGDDIRLISARRAIKSEVNAYEG